MSDAKDEEIRELRAALLKNTAKQMVPVDRDIGAAHREQSAASLSWGGFNLHGDSESISKAIQMLYDADTVPALKRRIAELQAKRTVEISALSIAGIGVKHFGNPIPRSWYSAAQELIDLMQAT